MTEFIGTRRIINFKSKIGPFLRSFFGIGYRGANMICIRAGIKYNATFEDISSDALESIDSSVRFFFVPEPELNRRVSRCLRLRVRSGCYRGVRISQGLPSRGQRSRTNGRTIRSIKEKIYMQIKQDLQYLFTINYVYYCYCFV
jgi:small subunit ribosomal protein S13